MDLDVQERSLNIIPPHANQYRHIFNWQSNFLTSLTLFHFQMTIDVLKFDIEFSEWGAIEAMRREGCLKNVRQMAFEIHMWTDEDPAAYSLLRTNGFPRKVVT